MEETSMNYSLLKFGAGGNSSESVPSAKGMETKRITIQRSTLFVIIISVTVLIVASELFVYLMSSKDSNCNVVFPEGYSVEENSMARKKSTQSVETNSPRTSIGTSTLTPKQTRDQSTKDGRVTTVASKQTTGHLGCPYSWVKYEQSCYYFSNQSVNWLDALVRCQNLGGSLAEISKAEENEFLRSQAKLTASQECFPTTSIEYQGRVNTTFDGYECQRWDSQKPHKHTRNNIDNFPETRLADAANYCRDPDMEGIPWCYTTDPDKRWQYCDIHKCSGGHWWLGMVILEGKWKWMKEQTELKKGYTNWGPSEPSNGNCGSFGSSNFAWSGEKCGFPLKYICEK